MAANSRTIGTKENTNIRSKKANVPTEETGRIQPQAKELEEAVLGALMLEKEAFLTISDFLRPESFYDKSHEIIFTAIRDLAIQQKPIDVLTVIEQLRKMGKLEIAGGATYIAQLSTKVLSSAHLEYHARIIAQKYLARELIMFSSSVTTEAFDETRDIEEVMQEAEGKLFEISQQNLKKDFTHINPVIQEAFKLIGEAYQNPEGLSGLQSGFKDLDKITSGWQKSDLIIIAARPAMGKTAFVLSMAKNMAVKYNTPVAFFSLEMAAVQLVNRLIINTTEIIGEKIKNGHLNPEEWIQLDTRIKNLYNAPIYIDDTPGLSVFELRTKARRLVREHGVKCIVIDYLQLMNASGMNTYSREQEVSLISRSLKSLARELAIPIIALSQLNRQVENRTGKGENEHQAKRPQLSDLRESGAIEQDADIVCFIHRPEYYKIKQDSQGNDLTGKAEILIAKHRNGSTGEVILSFKREYIRFQNLDDDYIVKDFTSRLNKPSPNSAYAELAPANTFVANNGSEDEFPF